MALPKLTSEKEPKNKPVSASLTTCYNVKNMPHSRGVYLFFPSHQRNAITFTLPRQVPQKEGLMTLLQERGGGRKPPLCHK